MTWKAFDTVDIVRINETAGENQLDNRRILLLDAENLRQLRRALYDRQGTLEAGRLIWNWGYANGYQDALAVKKSFTKKKPIDWFRAGIELLTLRGFARFQKVPETWDETNETMLELEWQSSWELEEKNGIIEPSEFQSCTTLSGYLSGFAGAVIGKNVFFIETECRGRGDECCRAVAKLEWKDDDAEVKAIEKLAGEFMPENFNFNELLADNAPATERIKSLIDEIEQQKEEIRTLQTQVRYLQEISSEEKPIREIIGTSAIYKKAVRNAEKVAQTDSTVLICGETGTGKELFARYIHANSLLKNRPLITVNCAALPASLVESELFGHEKGAFTGAVQRKLGRFEIANGATVFLDEVGELALETQAKFLRVLQEGEFERVGGTQTIKVKVRVLAATNRNLAEMVEEGKFRADLFYRLNVFPVTIPPLRSRGDDLVLLINYFAQKFRRRFQKPLTSVSQTSIDDLRKYGFPGNVRELQHLVERAVLLSEGEILHIPLPDSKNIIKMPFDESSETVLTLEEMERAYIERILQKSGGMIAGKGGAAEMLDLPPSTLRSRMKKLGIK